MSVKGFSGSSKVIEYIQGNIFNGRWASGDKLPTEPELCQETGVSRSCVREAVKILEASNIVQIRRGDGTYLSDADSITFTAPLLFKVVLSGYKLNEMCDFRESIEMAVMRLAIVNAKEEDVASLHKCNDAMVEYIKSGAHDPEKMFELDLAFHEVLGEATHNSIMQEIYAFSFEVFASFIKRNYQRGQNLDSALETHKYIIEALESKDFIKMGFAVCHSVGVWSDWIERQNARDVVLGSFLNGDQSLFND